ncbi:MAG TPA: hypothetical protein PK264_17290, partial [Hyphomicrobiaceae bacterium]|nr:hypothetical protein [Hyphomicrobiaceae bacterium]
MGQPGAPYDLASYAGPAARPGLPASPRDAAPIDPGWGNGQLPAEHPADPGHDGSVEHYPDEAEEPERQSRGKRTIVLVGALIGAIVAGGALAVAYKRFV